VLGGSVLSVMSLGMGIPFITCWLGEVVNIYRGWQCGMMQVKRQFGGDFNGCGKLLLVARIDIETLSVYFWAVSDCLLLFTSFSFQSGSNGWGKTLSRLCIDSIIYGCIVNFWLGRKPSLDKAIRHFPSCNRWERQVRLRNSLYLSYARSSAYRKCKEQA